MNDNELIPYLFRTEFRKITSVLCKTFGIAQIEAAEDIVSDTFLVATENWRKNGVPDNPVGWLYSVAKNKTKDFLKRHKVFTEKVAVEVRQRNPEDFEIEIDLSEENIKDSQLKMMFALCEPELSPDAQIGLALRILCGFGIEEIANAFLTSKEVINKRLFRAKTKLRELNKKIEFPLSHELDQRLENVMTTLYLMFNEGYYSSKKDFTVRKDICLEAMRLTYLLSQHNWTSQPKVNALLSLMCFHSSRFEARTQANGEIILYEEQDTSLWNQELIEKGEYYLNEAARGMELSKYHLEAAIAYWHTQLSDEEEKWENILQLYNQLLQLDYSPIAALNRTYALAKARNKKMAIKEAEKLKLTNYHLYHSLLGNLYLDIDNQKALVHFQKALDLIKSKADRELLVISMSRIKKDS
ncbi:RNA polymerase sigma factor [Flavobacteriaceae bacterium M23B6Z8]